MRSQQNSPQAIPAPRSQKCTRILSAVDLGSRCLSSHSWGGTCETQPRCCAGTGGGAASGSEGSSAALPQPHSLRPADASAAPAPAAEATDGPGCGLNPYTRVSELEGAQEPSVRSFVADWETEAQRGKGDARGPTAHQVRGVMPRHVGG